MKLFLRSLSALALIALIWSSAQGKDCQASMACPFCGSMQGNTLVKEVQQARFVIYGTPSNPQIRKDADGKEYSSTEFSIDDVVKNDPFLKNKKSLTLPRYIPPTTTGPDKLIVFCDIINQQADTYLYLSVPGKDGALVKYLKEALTLDEKDIPKRLRFYFDYLDHSDNEIATDAYKEFAKAEYSDVVTMVKAHGNDAMRKRLQSWLKDPNTAVYRYGLIGLMLGLCGQKDDGEVFVSLLNDPDKSLISGVDGILAGYILVDKDNGWNYTKALLSAPDKDFTKRYAALRTVRFLWESHVGHVPADQVLDGVALLLDQGDIADLAIEDLRKWKQWKYTGKILASVKKESHNAPIVQRSILRYMIACPEKEAVQYVEEVKKTHPEKVKDAKELLELEKSMAAPPVDANKKQ